MRPWNKGKKTGPQSPEMIRARVEGRRMKSGFSWSAERKRKWRDYQVSRNRFIGTPTKTCCKCDQDKSRDDFYGDRRRIDGLSSNCKLCHSAITKKYDQAHPDRSRTKCKLRDARRKSNGGTLSLKDWLEIKENHNFRCATCGVSENELQDHPTTKCQRLTLDHIIPVFRGGPTSKENIQPLCFSCNARKGVKVDIKTLL